MKALARRLSILIVAWAGCFSIAAAVRPNVIFLLADDQRADTIAALGNPHIQTPNLDRLVREGFVFNRAYCMGSRVPAVCVPSRAMMLTGRGLFAATHTNNLGEIPPGYVMWPELFRQAGYKTVGIGKWHNDRASYLRAFSAGGPVFFGGMGDHQRLPVHDYGATKSRVAESYSSALFADAAIGHIKASKGQSFVMYVAFTAPHDPRVPPPAYAGRYSAAELPVPVNFTNSHAFDNGEMDVRDEKLLPRPLDPAAIKGELAAYYAMITHLDAQIGRILKALREAGLADNTIVIYAADNGLALGSHGLLGKQNLYEPSVRVPLILSGPTITLGRSSALCYLYDLYPTLCELAGLSAPGTVEGKSLLPIIKGQQAGIRDSIFCAYRDVQRMVCDERWKLIVYPQIKRRQLFDLTGDPNELADLSGRTDHEGQLLVMTRKLAALQRQARDPLAIIE